MNYSNPIHLAAQAGDVEQVATLLRKNRRLVHAREKDNTPLHCAATEAIAHLLIEKGARVNVQGWMKQTPLHSAAAQGNVDVAQLLIRYKANVNAKGDRGDIPLHWAANATMAQLLIDCGARLETQDHFGQTPLHRAASHGHHDVVTLLIKLGANIHTRNNWGETPLYEATMGMPPQKGAFNAGHLLAAHQLIEAGAEINAIDENSGFTPLHGAIFRAWLIERENEDMIRLLINMGADVYSRNKAGQTPLHMAKGKQRIVDLLNGYIETIGPAPSLSPEQFVLQLVRTHPRRQEAITTVREALLARWILDGSPRIATSVQTQYASIKAIAVSPDGEIVAIGSSEGTIEFRRWDDLSLVKSITSPFSDRVTSIDFSADGRWIVVADGHERIYLIDRLTELPVAQLEGGEWTSTVLFDPSCKLLASACSFQGGGHVSINRIESNGQPTLVHELDRSMVYTPAEQFVDTLAHIAFSPDSHWLALFETSAIYHQFRPRGWRGDVVLYSVETGKLQWQVSIDAIVTDDERSLKEAGHPMGFFTEILFVDNAELVCGATNGLLLFFNVSSGKLTRRIFLHSHTAVRSINIDSSSSVIWAILGDGKLALIPLS